MAAKAILAPKPNSFQFEDRVLELGGGAAVRVGRAHKEDKADSDNGYFDCKVLSRSHASLSWEGGRFFVQDTGSSNGTFVNNIRLSKCGEESKVTEIFTGDSLRFGSDVVDKARNVTQKCVVARLTLLDPDTGAEAETRPRHSRLFRPGSSEEVASNNNNNNGGSHEVEVERVGDMARRLATVEAELGSVAARRERDATEITKLRLLVDTQNTDIANLEAALADTQAELEAAGGARAQYEAERRQLESVYVASEAKLQQQLEASAAHEISLLDRIKSLESESGYQQAEVDKVVVKESSEFEYKQELEYKLQCAATELQHCRMQLQQAEASRVVQRSEEDVQLIAEQGAALDKLRQEVAYYKQELIDARSRKAAAEDELSTVKGTVETITNSSKALANEIEQLQETVAGLNKRLGEETARADHLQSLVEAMEAQPGVEAKSKVEISDLKSELASSQQELRRRTEEVQVVKDKVTAEQETVQQKEIEISGLNGKLQFLEEELELVKQQTGDCGGLQAEINVLRKRCEQQAAELAVVSGDNEQLSGELQQLQLLYAELKKMRGRGEEAELLEAAQRDVVAARDSAQQQHAAWQAAAQQLELVAGERDALLQTVEQLRSSEVAAPDTPAPAPSVDTADTVPVEVSRGSPLMQRTMAAGEAVMANIGTLKLYEILLGLVFISVIISWNPYYS